MMQQKVKTTRAPRLRLDKNRRLTPMQIYCWATVACLAVLLLALLVLVAAGGYFAVTGHKLYESAIQATPIDTLYSSISSREGFVPYAQLPQTYINAVISAEDSRFTRRLQICFSMCCICLCQRHNQIPGRNRLSRLST